MDDLFDKYIKGTDKKLKSLDDMIYKVFLDYFVDSLSLDGNRVKYTKGNIDAVNRLDSVFGRFGTAIQKIGEWIIKGILEIMGRTIIDYAKFDTKAVANGVKVVEDIRKHSSTTINQNLNLSMIFADVKRDALILMAKPDGITLKDLRKALHNKVIDNQIASRYFARWTHDIYSQYQRVGANELRKTLGLKYAIYQGGLIETTRQFCNDRNNKVFHEDEIMKWADLDWAGKPEIGYNPIADLGGYNCRHRLDWISDEMAESLTKNEEYKNVELEVIGDNLTGLTNNDILKIAGVPTDINSPVTIKYSNRLEDDWVIVDVDRNKEGIIMERRINTKDKYIKNEYFRIKEAGRYKGKGAEIFASQVVNAQKYGYKYIKVDAAGDKNGTMNGYYTWARLGYIPESKNVERYQIDRIRALTGVDFIDFVTMMRTDSGILAWKEHGRSYIGVFDLSANSESIITLNNYLKNKKSK